MSKSRICPLVIGAPFGEWFACAHATSTLGTYTEQYRGGLLKRFWRVLRTVRYYAGIKAWKNKLGLPNPGLADLQRRVTAGKIDVTSCIISVHGFSAREWFVLVSNAVYLHPVAVELNMSCPNVSDDACTTSDYRGIFERGLLLAKDRDVRIIVKLPPVNYAGLAATALDAGITSFHCCNTLPTPGGGLSGKPLKMLSLQACRDIQNMTSARSIKLTTLIGGGGVTCYDDAVDYLHAGATHVSVASVLFFPWKWLEIARIARLLHDRALGNHTE